MPAAIPAIIGLAVSAAGTGLGIASSESEKNAMNNAVSSQLSQQSALQKQGQSLAESNEQASTPKAAGQDISQGSNQAAQEYAKLNAIPLTSTASPNAMAVAQNPTTTTGADSKAQVGLSNAASAPLQGVNDWQVQQWINNLQTDTGLKQLQNTSQNSASLLPLQLQQAQTSQSGLAGIGSLLGSLGGLASTYGAVNGAFSPTTTTVGYGGSLTPATGTTPSPLTATSPFGANGMNFNSMYNYGNQ